MNPTLQPPLDGLPGALAILQDQLTQHTIGQPVDTEAVGNALSQVAEATNHMNNLVQGAMLLMVVAGLPGLKSFVPVFDQEYDDERYTTVLNDVVLLRVLPSTGKSVRLSIPVDETYLIDSMDVEEVAEFLDEPAPEHTSAGDRKAYLERFIERIKLSVLSDVAWEMNATHRIRLEFPGV